MIKSINVFFQQRFQHWLTKRMPPNRMVELDLRNLFIFPSRSGLLYLLCSVLVWLLGTNYQSNLALACSYFMLAIFIVAIFHTFSNLAGLSITALQTQPVFAGDDSCCVIQLHRKGRAGVENLLLSWPNGRPQAVNIGPNSSVDTSVYFPTATRGYCHPGRLLLESYYPLGLLRCWTHVDLSVSALVYPAPIDAGPLPMDAVSRQDGDAIATAGGDDFIGLKDYQPGESLKHIAWKQYARGQKLLSKDYCDYRSHQMWLQWDDLPGMETEARLARLCDWLLSVSKTDELYGLRLPGIELAPAKGFKHKDAGLEALATFDLPPLAAGAHKASRGRSNAD